MAVIVTMRSGATYRCTGTLDEMEALLFTRPDEDPSPPRMRFVSLPLEEKTKALSSPLRINPMFVESLQGA